MEGCEKYRCFIVLIVSCEIISWFFSEQLLGSPEDSDLGFLRSDNAKKYLKRLRHVPKKSLVELFPDASPVALDLAQKMLQFDPSKRITGKYILLFKNSFSNLCLVKFIFSYLNQANEDAICSFSHDDCVVEEALKHPFVSSLHEINEEPICKSPFIFNFEQENLSEEDIKELIWLESSKLNIDKMQE